jgi:CheY-like chemotaxis protein
MNLAVNARDAMPDGGILSFEITRLKLGPEDSPPIPELDTGDWIRITVKDTGVGIRSKDFPHIFEPFYSTKPYGEGTGLGLAQAYGIIKQHGGHIDVHSRINTGTSFIIYLPALPVSSGQDLDQKDDSPVIGEGELILLVEDDHITRDALQSMLEAYNYRVMIAANGVEALEIYEKRGEGITLVVSDVVMPEMGGVDLYHALCERWPDVKMLFITGHPLNEDDQALLEQGRVHWLQKPFSVAEFNQVIKGLITQTDV